MRLIIYGLNFSPELIGVGKYTGELAEYLALQSHEVKIVTAYPYYPDWQLPSTGAKFLWRTESLAGATVHRYPLYVPKRPSGLRRVLHLMSFAFLSLPVILWQALTWRPDAILVIAPTLAAAPGGLLASWLGGAKSWLHIQDFEIDAAFDLGILKGNSLRKLALAFERGIFQRYDAVSSISKNMCATAVEKGVAEKNLKSFPNWVDTNLIHPLADTTSPRREYGIGHDKTVVLYSGNMNEKQGVETIIDAARATAERTDIIYVLAGEGPVRGQLKQQAQGLENVVFLPLQPVDKLNQLLNIADIHILPQLANAADLVMPSKLTGMLASGRPVIAGAGPHTQIAETIAKSGVAITPESSAELASAIIVLADDEDTRTRMGGKAREIAVREWEKTNLLNKFISELKEIVGS